jgi:hypothetical protein
MFPRTADYSVFSSISLLTAVLATAGPIWGQIPPITCKAIAAGTVADGNGIDLMADIPIKSKTSVLRRRRCHSLQFR